MRIIAGSAKGRRLLSSATLDIRPTSDRVRENLFNILMPRIAGARFLDLFCGTGANGIEALSRGAAHATFIDNSTTALRLTRDNLERCRLGGAASVERLSLPEQLQPCPHPFDIIMADPPYAYEGYETLLATLVTKGFLASDGVVVVETGHKTTLPDSVHELCCTQQRRYGDTALTFYS